MAKLIISLIIWCSSVAAASAAGPADIAADAPERYVVVKGDTLVSIGVLGSDAKYLKRP